MAIYSGFSHRKWWFSIAMLNYQRVMTKIFTKDKGTNTKGHRNGPRLLVAVAWRLLNLQAINSRHLQWTMGITWLGWFLPDSPRVNWHDHVICGFPWEKCLLNKWLIFLRKHAQITWVWLRPAGCWSNSEKAAFSHVPSGNLTVCYWTWPLK